MNSIEEKTGHMFNEGIIKQIAAFEAEVKHNLNSSQTIIVMILKNGWILIIRFPSMTLL